MRFYLVTRDLSRVAFRRCECRSFSLQKCGQGLGFSGHEGDGPMAKMIYACILEYCYTWWRMVPLRCSCWRIYSNHEYITTRIYSPLCRRICLNLLRLFDPKPTSWCGISLSVHASKSAICQEGHGQGPMGNLKPIFLVPIFLNPLLPS